MAQLNDLLVLGYTNLLGTVNAFGEIIATKFNGDGSSITNISAGNIAGTLGVGHGGTGIASMQYKNAVLIGNSTTVTSSMQPVRTASGAFYATAQDAKPSFGTLPVAQGGTGATTFTSNAVLTGDTTNAFKAVATADGALYATKANEAPQFGTLPVGQGGTGRKNWTAYGLIYASAAATLGQIATGTSGYVLQSGGSSKAPSWIQATNANTASTIVKRDSSGNFSAGTITADLNGLAKASTYIRVYHTEPTNGTWYENLFTLGHDADENYYPRAHDGFRHYVLNGTDAALGHSILQLGNAKVGVGTFEVGNKKGRLRIYSGNKGYVDVYATDSASNSTHYIPATGGTLLNDKTLVWGDADSSLGVIGTLTINGTVKTVYDSFLYRRGVSLADSAITDINTIKKPSIYYSNESSESAVLTNAPTTTAGFRLITLAGYQGSADYGSQMAFSSSGRVFWRSMGNSNGSPSDWYMWVKFKRGTAIGSSTKSFYLTDDGVPTEGKTYAGGTKVTLNSADKGEKDVSFFAPTAAGTLGAVLVSTAATPGWSGNVFVTSSTSSGQATPGTINALSIYGATYGNTAANTKIPNKLSYGDPGPQLRFNTSSSGSQAISLIYTDNDSIYAGNSLTMTTTETDAAFIAPTIKSNLYSAKGYTNGSANYWYNIATFTGKRDASTNIDTSLTLLVTGFYGNSSYINGTLKAEIRWDKGTTATVPNKAILRWLNADSHVTRTNFILTYKYDTTSQIATIKIYATFGPSTWESANFTKLVEHAWGKAGGKQDWILYQREKTDGVTAIPSDETQVTSTFGITQTSGLQITNDDAAAHISFSRASWNYIQAPTGSTIALVTNSTTTDRSGKASLVINATNLYPGTTKGVSLGSSDNQWNTVYANNIILSSTANGSQTASSTPAVRIGSSDSAIHLIIDRDAINAKATSTTAGQLSINESGGLVVIGSGGVKSGGNYQVSAKGKGYYLVDKNGYAYAGIYDNGSNLWIGSTAQATKHHAGGTYISSGHNGTSGNTSVYISVPNAGNTDGTSYYIFHEGYLNVSKATAGTLSVSRGGTGCSTLTSGYALIGNGANAVQFRLIVNNTSISHLGWTSATADTSLVTRNTIAYWDGRYNSDSTNLSYIKATTETTTSRMYPLWTTGEGTQKIRVNAMFSVWRNSTSAYLTIGDASNLGGYTLHKGNGAYVDFKVNVSDTSNKTISFPDVSATVAMRAQPNNFIHASNEMTIIDDGFANDIYFNWTTLNRKNTGAVKSYRFCKGDGNGTLVPVYASTFYGALSGNASSATQLATARTFTIGATGKTFDGTANVSWTPYEMRVTRAQYNVGSNMNQVADHGCELGMANLSGTDKTVNPNGGTSWHHYINMTWSDCADNNASTTNEWCTQIANKAGTTDLWVRSRNGGTIADGTAWAAPWTRILTGSNWTNVIPTATNSTLGITKVWKAADCTSYTDDDYALSAAAVKKAFTLFGAKNGVYYVTGNTSGTEGTWTGSNTDIPSLFTGLTIAYKIGIAGADTTTLNLTTAAGASGAKTVYRNNGKLTTHLPVNSVVHLTYDGTYWRWADYDSNTNTQIRVYRQTSGYNGDYPILVSRTATSGIGTAGTNSSYTAVYGVIAGDGANTPTINPHTGTINTPGYVRASWLYTSAATEVTSTSKVAVIGSDNYIYWISPSNLNSKLLLAGDKLTSATVDGVLESTASLKINTADSTVYDNNDGMILTATWSSSYGTQIWLDDGSGGARMAIRNRSSTAWNDWREVLTSGNYSSYALPLSGGTMTGTINSCSIVPKTAVAYSTGSSAKPWTYVYAKGFMVYDGATADRSYGGFYITTNGTTSTGGVATLQVGNTTATGTIGNSYGRLLLCSSSTGYAYLCATSGTTSGTTHYLPVVGGTLWNSNYCVGVSGKTYGSLPDSGSYTGQIFFAT